MNGLKKSAKNGEDNGMPSLPTGPTGPTQVTKTENMVLWRFSGRPIYSHLTLEGRVMH